MHWSIKDILYVKVNEFKPKKDFLPFLHRQNYPNYIKNWFTSYAYLDIAVYNHFYDVLKNKIASQRDNFKGEVETFKKIREYVDVQCGKFKETKAPFSNISIESSSFNEEFNVTENDCNLMTLSHDKITLIAQNQIENKNQLLHLKH